MIIKLARFIRQLSTHVDMYMTSAHLHKSNIPNVCNQILPLNLISIRDNHTNNDTNFSR